MQLYPLTKIVWANLVRFGQIWVKFGQNWSEIWAKLIRFGQIWLNLVKIEAKYGQNLVKILAKMIKFGQIWLDLGKIKILHPQKHLISYSYVCANCRIEKGRNSVLIFIFFLYSGFFATEIMKNRAFANCRTENVRSNVNLRWIVNKLSGI